MLLAPRYAMTGGDATRAEVRRLLDARWPLVHDSARERVEILRAFLARGDDCTVAEQDEARDAAHRLVGSLGMFGRRDASRVAAAVEDALIAGALSEEVRVALAQHLDRLDLMLGAARDPG